MAADIPPEDFNDIPGILPLIQFPLGDPGERTGQPVLHPVEGGGRLQLFGVRNNSPRWGPGAMPVNIILRPDKHPPQIGPGQQPAPGGPVKQRPQFVRVCPFIQHLLPGPPSSVIFSIEAGAYRVLS